MRGRDVKFLSFLFKIALIFILCTTIGCSNIICNYHHAKRPHEKASSKVGLDCNLGYWEKELGDNIWIVDYVAYYTRDVLALEYHNFYRCAELTLKQKSKYFVVLKHMSNEGYRRYVSSEIGSNYRITKYALKICYSTMTIKMYKNKPSIVTNCINASKVIEYYGKYIEHEPLYTDYTYKGKYFNYKTIMNNCKESD